MKDTPELREWVNEQISKYFVQMGVNRYPKVYYSLEDMPSKFHCDCHGKQYKKWAAVTWVGNRPARPHSILLNIPYHKSYTELENTIVHELMHIRFPGMNHNDEYDPSEEFFTKLGMILMGKHYPKAVRKRKSKK